MDQGFFDQALAAILQMWPGVGYVFSGLGALVVLGYAYVKATPNQEDDAWWARLEAIPVLGMLLKALASLSPVQRAEAAPKPLAKKKK